MNDRPYILICVIDDRYTCYEGIQEVRGFSIEDAVSKYEGNGYVIAVIDLENNNHYQETTTWKLQ